MCIPDASAVQSLANGWATRCRSDGSAERFDRGRLLRFELSDAVANLLRQPFARCGTARRRFSSGRKGTPSQCAVRGFHPLRGGVGGRAPPPLYCRRWERANSRRDPARARRRSAPDEERTMTPLALRRAAHPQRRGEIQSSSAKSAVRRRMAIIAAAVVGFACRRVNPFAGRFLMAATLLAS